VTNNFFNIALLPADESLAYSCTYLAQTNLKEQSNEYLLGENAHPHITICQFSAQPEHVDKVWSAIEDLQTEPLKLSFGHIYIRPGVGLHAGKTWIGLTILKEAKLIKLQKSIYEKLVQSKMIPDTKTGDYSPHLTWARCEAHTPITISVMPPSEMWQNQHAFNLTIGLSNVNGIYQECLFSHGQTDLAKRSLT
jgi:2'-5' RNA ligase